MTLDQLNAASSEVAHRTLLRCCGSTTWAERVAAARPFSSFAELLEASDQAWARIDRRDLLEAMGHHPRIGADVAKLREKFSATADWSAGEQAGVADASDEVLAELRDANLAYEERFGHIFLVCASGLSAREMLEKLRDRMDNAADREQAVAAEEQRKITHIRLRKLLSD